MNKSFKFLFTFIFAISLSFSAQAQEFNASGAETIKTELQEWLDLQLSYLTVGTEGEGGLQKTGDVTVTPENGYYAAKLPHLSFVFSDTARLDIGQIAANIIPTENNTWRITVAYPKTMKVFDDANVPLAELSFGKQNFGGVWDVEHNTYLQFQGAYENIALKDILDQVGSLSIGSLNVLQDFRPMAENTAEYAGPLNFAVKDIKVKAQGNTSGLMQLAIAGIDSKTTYSGMPLFNDKEFQKNFLKFATNPEENTAESINYFFDMINAMPSAADSKTTISGLSAQHTDDDNGEQSIFHADTIELTSDAKGIKSDQVGFGFSYAMNGMKFNAATDTPLPMRPPESLKFDMRVESLPLKSMIEILKTATAQALDDTNEITEEQRSQMLMFSMMSFPKLMAQHGTTLNINETHVTSPDLKTTLKGQVTADAAAAYGAIGMLVLKITGLETAIAALKSSNSANGLQGAMVQQLMGGLSVAQAMAKTEADGAHTYTFELTPEGKTLMNGMDLMALKNARQH